MLTLVRTEARTHARTHDFSKDPNMLSAFRWRYLNLIFFLDSHVFAFVEGK